jgi:hypothetical protein
MSPDTWLKLCTLKDAIHANHTLMKFKNINELSTLNPSERFAGHGGIHL